jgi:hypothetical protein
LGAEIGVRLQFRREWSLTPIPLPISTFIRVRRSNPPARLNPPIHRAPAHRRGRSGALPTPRGRRASPAAPRARCGRSGPRRLTIRGVPHRLAVGELVSRNRIDSPMRLSILAPGGIVQAVSRRSCDASRIACSHQPRSDLRRVRRDGGIGSHASGHGAASLSTVLQRRDAGPPITHPHRDSPARRSPLRIGCGSTGSRGPFAAETREASHGEEKGARSSPRNCRRTMRPPGRLRTTGFF